MKKIALILTLLVLSGCSGNFLFRDMQALQDQPISLATRYLGDPAEQRNVLDKKMYTWINWGASPQWEADRQVAYADGNIFYTDQIKNRNPWNCRLDLITDNEGFIVHTQYQGAKGACPAFRSKISSLIGAAERLGDEVYTPPTVSETTPDKDSVQPPSATVPPLGGINP